jgi:hypothetical protein
LLERRRRMVNSRVFVIGFRDVDLAVWVLVLAEA